MKSIKLYIIKINLLLLVVLLIGACKKDAPPVKDDLYPETPVNSASSSAIKAFYTNIPFFELFVYRFNPETNKWTNEIRSHFPTVPLSDSTALGFTNPFVNNSGVALFDMVRLYTPELGSNNIKSAKINAPKVLKFFPDFEGAKTGIVKVIDQDVLLTKRDSTTFKIGISGQGTYDERTKIMNFEVKFNETAIGKPAEVKRRYSISVNEQVLN